MWVLLVVVAVLTAANLGLLLTRGAGGQPAAAAPAALATSAAAGLTADALRELALKLENQGLHAVAAKAWVDYLAAASSDPKDASAIWYRIGKLHQDGGAHAEALDAYYRSESLDPQSGLKDEIGRRAQEALESMGKFAALKQELASRVSMDDAAATAAGEVVAEIGARKITRAELDLQIEASIENQLARFGARLPEAQRRQQKEAMLKQFSGDSQRLQFLQSFLVQEILYRKARESKLVDEPGVRAQLQDMERTLLAQQMMAAEVEGKLTITDGDLSTYYEANKAAYAQPESASVSQLLVADEEAARALAGELKAADAATFAAKASVPAPEGAAGSAGSAGSDAPVVLVRGAAAPQGWDAAQVEAVFAAPAGAMIPDPMPVDGGYRLVFVLSREPGRQKPFEEVRDEVFQALRSRKEREVEQQLMDRLRDEYNVVIHQGRFKAAAEEDN